MIFKLTPISMILFLTLPGPAVAMDFYRGPLDFWHDTVVAEEQEEQTEEQEPLDKAPSDPYTDDLQYFSKDAPPELRELYLEPSLENASRFVEATKRRIGRARLMSEMIKRVRSDHGIIGIEENTPPPGGVPGAIRVSDSRSVSVYLFLSSVCEACHDQAAEIDLLALRYPFMRLSGILTDGPTWGHVHRYLEDKGFHFPVFPADPDLIQAFRVDTTPYLVFYSPPDNRAFFLRGRHGYAQIDQRIREIYGLPGGGL
jgi:hypothetical protein